MTTPECLQAPWPSLQPRSLCLACTVSCRQICKRRCDLVQRVFQRLREEAAALQRARRFAGGNDLAGIQPTGLPIESPTWVLFPWPVLTKTFPVRAQRKQISVMRDKIKFTFFNIDCRA